MVDDTTQKLSDVSTKDLRITTLGTGPVICKNIYKIAELEGLRPDEIPGLVLYLLGPVLYAEDLISSVTAYLTPRLEELVYWQRMRRWVWTPCKKIWLWYKDVLDSKEGWILLLFIFGCGMIWCLDLLEELKVFRVMVVVRENREAIADAYF